MHVLFFVFCSHKKGFAWWTGRLDVNNIKCHWFSASHNQMSWYQTCHIDVIFALRAAAEVKIISQHWHYMTSENFKYSAQVKQTTFIVFLCFLESDRHGHHDLLLNWREASGEKKKKTLLLCSTEKITAYGVIKHD